MLVGALLALIAAALILALVELSGDPQPVAKAPSSTPTATPAGAPADDGGSAAPRGRRDAHARSRPRCPASRPRRPTPSGTTPDPTQTTPPDPAATTRPPRPPAISPSGPPDKTGWTAVLASTHVPLRGREEGARRGRRRGRRPESDDFSSLRKGYWVVFSGQYDSRSAAESAAEDAGSGAYARRIVPR